VVVISVSETTVKEAAAVVPKWTDVAPVKVAPVIVTGVPPAVGPDVGETALTVGSAANLKWSAGEMAEVPPGVVTVTSTVPAAWAGEVVVILLLETTVKETAAVVPKCTAVAPVKWTPVIVARVPPEIGPEVGETAWTAGTGPAALAGDTRPIGSTTAVRVATAMAIATTHCRARLRIPGKDAKSEW
jgi:hypothetical protein